MKSLLLPLAAILALAVSTPASAQHLRPDDLAKMPVSKPTKVEAYGADPLQFGELRLPAGRGPFPVIVIIHGGCWTKGFATLSYMSPLASDLAARGVATWNIEYRQIGDPGAGWPGSFLDWANATDHLRALAKTYPLDLSHVVVTGHSAGGHAALWVAGRGKLPIGSPIRGGPPLKVVGAVAIDGPGDIADFIGLDAQICGQPVIVPFMGGDPKTAPARYAQGDPIRLTPLGVPSVLISSAVLLPKDAEHYRVTATTRGDKVKVLDLTGVGHFDMLSPKTASGAQVEALIVEALGKLKR